MKIWKSEPLRLTVTYPEGSDPFLEEDLTVESPDNPELSLLWLNSLKRVSLYGHRIYRGKGRVWTPWEVDMAIPSVWGDTAEMKLVQGDIVPVPELPDGAVP